MTPEELAALLAVLRANGVTRYRGPDVELELLATPPARAADPVATPRQPANEEERWAQVEQQLFGHERFT